MKKRIFFIFCAVFLLSLSSAEIMKSRFKVTESEKEFDVMYYLTDVLKMTKVEKNDDLHVTQAFEIKKDGINAKVLYSLFTDKGGKTETLNMDYSTMVFMCLNNAAGYDVDPRVISMFNDSDVKKEFNADFGCTAFLRNPQSDYAAGYEFMMTEFFYKENQGLVMRSFLFNDFNFLGMDESGRVLASSIWYNNYHTFRFMEKNDKGEFVSK